jgi:DNA-binding IclR family transcriptional regulator
MDLLQRALDILEFVCVSGSASADETSEALGIPKSTVYRLLAALQKRDYIRHTSPNCYEVGPRLLMLQGITERQNRLIQSARPHLRQLSQSTGQTAHLAVLSASRLGYLGKVLLAFLPQPLRETTIDSLTLEKRTPNTITTIAALAADLEQVRNRGYALDNEEFNLGVRCIGAPIRNAAGDVIAAISISGLAARFTGDAFPAWVSAVCETARCISRDLGYQGPPQTDA